jgi:hypothetical protein
MKESRTTEERILDKLDSIDTRLASIDSTLAAQHISHVDLVRRTEIIELELKPIKKHIAMTEGAVKLVAGTVFIIGFVITLYKALGQ